MSTSLAIGQKNHWLLYPTHIDFSNGFAVEAETFNQSVPYTVENSVYDVDGNLLFYVRDGYIIDPNAAIPVGNTVITKEIAIAPLPGSCDIYCVFHLIPSFAGIDIYMQEVSMASGSPVIVNQGTVNTFPRNTGGIAISPILAGTEADRHIYFIGYNNIYKYNFNTAGLSLDQTIPSPIFGQTEVAEAEISPDGQWLAWNSNNMMVVMDLTNTANVFATNFSTFSAVQGFSFQKSEGQSYSLFVSKKTEGVYRWYFETPTPPSLFSNTQTLDYTQLTTGGDGKIYGVQRIGDYWQPEGELVSISNGGLITATGIRVYSGADGATQFGFALPDQIDGENESDFFGVPPITFDDLSINGTLLPTDVAGEVPFFYNCASMNLNIPSGSFVQQDVEIVSVDPGTGLPLYGSIYLDFSETYANAPDSDIRCWEQNCTLFDNYLNQTFRLTYTVINKCESVTQVVFFRVFGAPDSTKNNFIMNSGNGGSCPVAHTINEACGIGTFSANIDLSNSNGDVTYYRVDISEVDCFTGAAIETLYTGVPVDVSDIGVVNGLGINSFEINGTTGYFAINAAAYLGKCLKITTEVGNPCGFDTDYAYVKFDGNYLSTPYGDGTEALYQDAAEKEKLDISTSTVLVYPNPVNEKMKIEFDLLETQETIISIYNQAGLLVLEKRKAYSSGKHIMAVDLQKMPSGLYVYRLQTGVKISSGKIMKL